MRNLSYDAVIAGGGFAGLIAAAALADLGLSVAVVEQGRRSFERRLWGELLHPTAVRALDRLGLAESLREGGAGGVRGFAAYASAHSPPALLPYASGMGLSVEHHRILASLRRTVASRRGVHLYEGKAQDLVRERGAIRGLRSEDGRVFPSPLVVVADGRHSRLRAALGLSATTKLLSRAVGTAIDASLLPVPGHGHVYTGGPGPVLVYPIASGEARVNVDVPLDAPRSRERLLDFVRARYAPFVPTAIFAAILTAFATKPLLGAVNHAVTTRSCAVRGAVLLGDSGGCSHPLTATGMTCAAHDATVLAAVLRETRDPERALLEYQRQRYRFVRARESFAQALYTIFRGSDEGARATRDALFHYWQSARARGASMAILAGEESRLRHFVAEYGRVVTIAMMVGLDRSLRQRSAASAAAALAGLASAARTSTELLADKIADRRERTLRSPLTTPLRGPRPPRAPSLESERAVAE